MKNVHSVSSFLLESSSGMNCLFQETVEMMNEALKIVNLNIEIFGKRDYEALILKATKEAETDRQFELEVERMLMGGGGVEDSGGV